MHFKICPHRRLINIIFVEVSKDLYVRSNLMFESELFTFYSHKYFAP